MGKFIDQAKHNEKFLALIETNFPNDFFDWKITISFYCCVHYLTEYLASRNISVSSHETRNHQLNPDSKTSSYPLSSKLWTMYFDFYRISKTARYNGIGNRLILEKKLQADFTLCKSYHDEIKNFVNTDLEGA